MIEYFLQIIAGLLAAIIVLSLHEYAHALVAYKCGDPTAKFLGRMTLNPAKHFDPLGLIAFAIAGFGWAKPVPINPNNFHNYRWGTFWTSAAGILTNLFTAFLFYPLYYLVVRFVCPMFAGKYAELFFYYFFAFLYLRSLSFCVFNLLPVYPLDGFRMIDAFNRRRGKVYWFIRNYGYYCLLGLILVHYAASRFHLFAYLDILGYVMTYAIRYLRWPIELFWNWIFGIIF